MERRPQILVIEDDEDIGLSIKYNLEKEGNCRAKVVRDGETGLREATATLPDLVILDLNLPGIDGLEVCKLIRKNPASAGVPILMLTARVEESDKIVGLELGADDYVTKPFSMKEILARVRAILRRTGRQAEPPAILSEGPLRIDTGSRSVTVAGTEVSLTRKEFDLLVTLIASRGRVLTRERLLREVWEQEYAGETRTVDVHVLRLRKKLGDPAQAMIETVVGVGYRLRRDGD